jgi:precorrin-4/cobalt-precorrin-4 C11-methyltransferase
MTDFQSDRRYPISIVGAGPGAPDLITVRGQARLAEADVVFYTGSLVPEQMLTHCHPEVEIIDTRSLVLETWRSQLAERAQAGQKVVRLQDGDPCLYGALHELVVYLLAHHLDFEIIPGVSAFQAAAARLQTELTVPNLVQTIILTRTQGKTDVPSREDLSQLAAHQASLCLYLSAHHCAKAQTQLLEHYPADTPLALCYRLGWPDEQVILGRLDELADLTRTANLTRTVLYVISPALSGSPAARSRLYSSDHAHIFRPKHRP